MKSAVKILFCLILVASTILTIGSGLSKAATIFKDVGPNHRAYNEITYLAQGKITSGDANGNFMPKSNVTRAQFAALLGRALDLDGTQRKTKFKDVGVSNFASGYIQAAVDKNIISGYSDGSFKPNGLVTRGEMAIMICKAFGYSFGNSSSGAAQAIISRGIDQGVEDGTFGSTRSALREETAIFLARAIDFKLRSKPTTSFSSEKYVNVNSLNVRKGPSTEYGVVGTLNKEEKVTTSYNVGNWTLVKTSNDVIGFASNYYLATSVDNSDDNSNNDSIDNGNANPQSLTSQTLVIDPGHGGTDPGKVGFGLKEKDIVLDTSLLLKKLLIQTPLNVKYTRETDVTLDLIKDRVPYALSVKGNTFVSIHANGGGGTGSETYYWGKASKAATNPYVSDSKMLAEFIQKRLIVALETRDRGIKHGDFHVIRENQMPAVLVELAFMDTKADSEKLNSPAYRQKAAEAIFLGLLDYYNAKGFDVAQYYNIVK
ncbi:N-acetylmuramoyl-L-alanine amidase [Bacillus massiliigorillae]|uniref:N-acetylmuramoyl-L-alanine amidase n=1 Tax=Bacillus massiliigorillae TaxID=1243664 RepID=UPI00039F975D|nr:N-acetylmuramoyl-L-alanine amidase [Bacillus massiliigorillae]